MIARESYTLQQFALASVYPRSIAWLVRVNEWNSFEKIVKYNCAVLGGYYNVLVPLTDQDTISEAYQHFLADYDPDLVVLAPGMTSNQFDNLSLHIFPFGVISWDLVSGFVSSDPTGGVSDKNATMVSEWLKFQFEARKPSRTYVAVVSEMYPETSKLAFVACGDVMPRSPMFDKNDEVIELDATGYRENFLERLLNTNVPQSQAGAYLTDQNDFISAPNRYQLNHLIKEEYKFPLSDAVEILRACCRLQHFPSPHESFISLTAKYQKVGGTPSRTSIGERPPAIVILLSDNFDIEEATLFWNLRANGFHVAWLSFHQIEEDLEAVALWLDSDSGGLFYWMSTGSDIAFSSSKEDFTRLQVVFNKVLGLRRQNYPLWNYLQYDDLIFYNYIQSPLLEERVLVVKERSKYSFVSKLPEEYSKHSTGMYTVTIKWNDFLLPQSSHMIQDKVSSETVRGFVLSKEGQRDPNTGALMHQDVWTPRFRITRQRHIKAQISTQEPLEFSKPSTQEVVETLFNMGGFSHIEQSSTAKYHTSFINRCGALTDTAYYLATSPYRELFEVLADNSNSNKKKVGWILDYPSKRRALHHLHLRDVLSKTTPTETKSYFNTVSDELPTEAFKLLEKGLLERGFQLSCIACSYKSWYPAEHVGQTFECSRCFQTQVYNANPLWLYKLPEVVFQGFEDNMQVPLLALDYLRRASKHSFEWVPDSNVYTHQEGSKKAYRNIDILCISDGKLYIGEAKSNDIIEADQFSFYEQVCKSVAVDGIVFATSQTHWNRGTQQRIDSLKAWFRGEVLIVTEKDLYFSTKSKT